MLQASLFVRNLLSVASIIDIVILFLITCERSYCIPSSDKTAVRRSDIISEERMDLRSAVLYTPEIQTDNSIANDRTFPCSLQSTSHEYLCFKELTA